LIGRVEQTNRLETAVGLAFVLMVAACGRFASLAPLPDGGSGSGDAGSATLTVTASTSAYTFHLGDVRTPTFTVTNTSSVASAAPQLAVVGLTLGTMSFTTNTCATSGGLQPGQSCVAVGNLAATNTGQASFQVAADLASTQLSLTVLATCSATCGPNGTTDCCASSVVPGNATGATRAGDTFLRDFDVAADGVFSDMSFPATVSDYRLDTYSVTVGRFRAFVGAGMGTQASAPADGTGAHAKIAGSGWNASDDVNLTANTTALQAALLCDATHQTWTTSPGSNEDKPINCVTWFEAFAFCIWDGGYLPTDLEFNYAAAGGSDQRAFPSSSPAGSTTLDCTEANFQVNSPPGTFCVSGSGGNANRVGSESPKGDGKFGQSDLAGNIWAWNLDAFGSLTGPCDDCANLTPNTDRVIRGGSFDNLSIRMRSGNPDRTTPTNRTGDVGFRCARTP
jgi:formylglycine-generating enzyme required for sulfatase activity